MTLRHRGSYSDDGRKMWCEVLHARIDATSFTQSNLLELYISKKPSSGFSITPDSHFNKFTDPNPLQQHCSWLDDIRQTIWDRIQCESEMIPSTEALYRHWRRTCWVLDMWKKANNNHNHGKECTEGCECTNCSNTQSNTQSLTIAKIP